MLGDLTLLEVVYSGVNTYIFDCPCFNADNSLSRLAFVPPLLDQTRSEFHSKIIKVSQKPLRVACRIVYCVEGVSRHIKTRNIDSLASQQAEPISEKVKVICQILFVFQVAVVIRFQSIRLKTSAGAQRI